MRTALDERRAHRETNLYDSASDESAHDQARDFSYDSDSDWMEAGAEVSHIRQSSNRQVQSRTCTPSINRSNRSVDRREGSYRRESTDSSHERRMYGPCGACGATGHDAHSLRRRCKFCKQVHEVGLCELFARFDKVTKLSKPRWKRR